MTEPIRIFIGTEAKTRVPELVLMHSIRSRTKADVEFVSMGDYEPWVVPKDVHQATGFSLRRWLIPEYCNFEGHAIYLDADQIVLSDIQELWRYGKLAGAIACCVRPDAKYGGRYLGDKTVPVPHTSVMVINCAYPSDQFKRSVLFESIRSKGQPHSKGAVKAYQHVMHGQHLPSHEVYQIHDHWNAYNECPKGTRLLHYTFETQQPWYQPWHKLCDKWELELKSAIEAGAVTRNDIVDALAMGQSGSKDWRKYGGLNEYWEKLFPLFDTDVLTPEQIA